MTATGTFYWYNVPWEPGLAIAVAVNVFKPWLLGFRCRPAAMGRSTHHYTGEQDSQQAPESINRQRQNPHYDGKGMDKNCSDLALRLCGAEALTWLGSKPEMLSRINASRRKTAKMTPGSRSASPQD